MSNDNFHYVGDGRGKRRVFVNGNELKSCIWADVERGIACICPHPLRIHRRKRDEVYSRKLRGVITIEFI
ncbi:TPA: hypothetical protein N2Q63_004708 [Citrobacter freundii]|nr:hypothetical protein [Citrobacter freundii]HCL6759651.1 hypothetical protein [Citrobacter freundii]HED2424947.1 hypothetical protein [Citrobacter freundii]HED3099320.1 hypothetical protein [Citrobacter freundii]HED3129570.1 hypothetical protein [Citrobacter freundii]